MTGTVLAFATVLAVLLGPIFIKPIERHVELFFLFAGIVTSAVSGRFDTALVGSALREPIELTLAVLIFGIAFRLSRRKLDTLFSRATKAFGQRWLCFGMTVALGLLAGFITAVVAALVLAEAVSLLKIDHSTEVAITVFGCFAIGLGAVATPLGMPASTLVLDALNADFWYLLRLLWPFVTVGIVLVAIPPLLLGDGRDADTLHLEREGDSCWPVLIRAARVYIFIVGLVGLAAGLRPTVDAQVRHLPGAILFWVNTISAVVDNATLAAVEIGPALNVAQQRFALMGLLISGGMLIPGNVPNIVAANRLHITSREWASHGIKTGIILLILCFAVLTIQAMRGK